MPKFFFRNITFLFVVGMSWNFVRIHDCPKSCANPITVTRIFSIGFFPLANGVYFVVIIKKTSLHNGNCPITDPITKMGVAHAFESCNCQYVSNEMLFIILRSKCYHFGFSLENFNSGSLWAGREGNYEGSFCCAGSHYSCLVGLLSICIFLQQSLIASFSSAHFLSTMPWHHNH